MPYCYTYRVSTDTNINRYHELAFWVEIDFDNKNITRVTDFGIFDARRTNQSIVGTDDLEPVVFDVPASAPRRLKISDGKDYLVLTKQSYVFLPADLQAKIMACNQNKRFGFHSSDEYVLDSALLPEVNLGEMLALAELTLPVLQQTLKQARALSSMDDNQRAALLTPVKPAQNTASASRTNYWIAIGVGSVIGAFMLATLIPAGLMLGGIPLIAGLAVATPWLIAAVVASAVLLAASIALVTGAIYTMPSSAPSPQSLVKSPVKWGPSPNHLEVREDAECGTWLLDCLRGKCNSSSDSTQYQPLSQVSPSSPTIQ